MWRRSPARCAFLDDAGVQDDTLNLEGSGLDDLFRVDHRRQRPARHAGLRHHDRDPGRCPPAAHGLGGDDQSVIGSTTPYDNLLVEGNEGVDILDVDGTNADDNITVGPDPLDRGGVRITNTLTGLSVLMTTVEVRGVDAMAGADLVTVNPLDDTNVRTTSTSTWASTRCATKP